MKELFFALLSAVLLSSCAVNNNYESEKMHELASSLTKLSASVESTVRYKNPPAGISDGDLLTLSTKHDPKMLEPFQSYKVRVLSKDRHSIVLVCDKEGSRGLLEESACTKELDEHLWQSPRPLPCKFTLSINEVCRLQ